MKKTFALLLFASLLFTACHNTKPLLPSVSGKAGEIIVVMEKPDWEGALGNDTRELLAGDCPWLATREPLYSLVNVVPSGFGDLFKVHRNIVKFDINQQVDSSFVAYRHDVWSQPQCVIQVIAKNVEEAQNLLATKGSMIINSIETAERDRVIRNSIRYEEGAVTNAVMEVFGGAPRIPTGYKLRKISEDFAWIAKDYQFVYQDLFIYRYPVNEAEPFTVENIIAHRNEMLKANVPGMIDNTYMKTSDGFPVSVEHIKYRGRYFSQTRGYWDVEGDYMGGPFVSHSFYSPDGSEIIVAEGFVYAPRYDKRQYLRQVESVLYSWEWAQKEEK